jgi:type I restriction enzyme S subunit
MSSKWRETSIGEVVELKHGYNLSQQARSSGTIPVISSSGVTNHHSEAMVKELGVVMGRYGTLGQIFSIEEDFWPLNTAQYVRDFKGNDPRFIAYFLHKHGYPPDKQEKATQTVLQQAELICKDWAG